MSVLAKTCLLLILVGLAASKSPPPGSNVLQERVDEAAKEWSLFPKLWPSLENLWKNLREGLRPHKDDRRWNGYDLDGYRPRSKRSPRKEEDLGTPGQALQESPGRFRREVEFTPNARKYFNDWNGLDLKGSWKSHFRPESRKQFHEEVQLRSKRSAKVEVEDELEDDVGGELEDNDGQEVKEEELGGTDRKVDRVKRDRITDFDDHLWSEDYSRERFNPRRYYRHRFSRQAPSASDAGGRADRTVREARSRTRPHIDTRTWNGYDLDGFRPGRRYLRRYGRESGPAPDNRVESKALAHHEDDEQSRWKRSVANEPDSHSRNVREARSRTRPHVDTRTWNGYDLDGFRPGRRYLRRYGREAGQAPDSRLEASALTQQEDEEQSRSKRSVANEPDSHSRTVREARSRTRPHVDTRTWNGYDLDGFRPGRRYLKRRYGREAGQAPDSRLEASALTQQEDEEQSRSTRSAIGEFESHSRTAREARRGSLPHLDTRMWNGHDLDGFRPTRRYIRRRLGREAASAFFRRNGYKEYNYPRRRFTRRAYWQNPSAERYYGYGDGARSPYYQSRRFRRGY